MKLKEALQLIAPNPPRRERKVSHAESCRRWQAKNPDYKQHRRTGLRVYEQGVRGLRFLFGDDNCPSLKPDVCPSCRGVYSMWWMGHYYRCRICECRVEVKL